MSHAAAAPDDVALAQALMEEETTLATASDIELARKLAERPATVYQEIALEEGQRNLAQAQAQAQQSTSAAADEAATAPAEQQEQQQQPPTPPPPPRCLTCDTAEHLSEITDVGHLCFSCLQHNCGAELSRLVFR